MPKIEILSNEVVKTCSWKQDPIPGGEKYQVYLDHLEECDFHTNKSIDEEDPNNLLNHVLSVVRDLSHHKQRIRVTDSEAANLDRDSKKSRHFRHAGG